MRKFIATACAFTILGFTIALANANSTSDTQSESQMQQQPGSADQSTLSQPNAATSPDPYRDPYNTGDMGSSAVKPESHPSGDQAAGSAADNSAGSVANEQTTTTRTETKWKDSKTCTDAEGVTYHRGKAGYDHCVTSAAAKKNAKKEQMGGTVGDDTGNNSVRTDTGIMDDSRSDDSTSKSAPTDSSAPLKQ